MFLFLQRLPANVRMVLASTSHTASLDELAELADNITEVAAPTVAATIVFLHLSSSPKWSNYVQKLVSFRRHSGPSPDNPGNVHPLDPVRTALLVANRNPHSVGIIRNMEKLLENASPPVPTVPR